MRDKAAECSSSRDMLSTFRYQLANDDLFEKGELVSSLLAGKEEANHNLVNRSICTASHMCHSATQAAPAITKSASPCNLGMESESPSEPITAAKSLQSKVDEAPPATVYDKMLTIVSEKPSSASDQDASFMKMALAEAETGARKGEIPVGAVLVLGDEVLAKAHNR